MAKYLNPKADLAELLNSPEIAEAFEIVDIESVLFFI